jgi:hypothetical protein
VIAACLEGEGIRVRRSAVEALKELGKSALPARATLETMGRHDPDDITRENAKKAAEQIAANTPPAVEVTRLRDEVDRLKHAVDALSDQLKRQETLGERKR